MSSSAPKTKSPKSRNRAKLSEGFIHRSTAKTRTPNVRARYIELSPMPHPRSSTRILGERGMFAVSSSANLTQLGPIMVARRKSRSNNGLDAVEVGCMWKLLCKKVSLPYIGNGRFCGSPSCFSNEKAPQAWACGAVRHACRMEARIL